jgi:SAM-dependent methyltransferase
VSDRAETPWFVAAFGAHYPLLYRHRDLAEARQCLELLPRLAPLVSHLGDRPLPVLDLGCGDGRHLGLLHESGVPAVGLDLSPQLLSGAGPGLDLVRGDMRRLPFVADCFGAVLSLFTAFGYFGTPAGNAAPVKEIARVLQAGGHWFLDYFDGDRVRDELGTADHVRERELDCLLVRETRRYQAERCQVIKDVVLRARPGFEREAAAAGVGDRGLTYREQVAVFTLAELDGMTGEQGLRRVAGVGDYEGAALGDGPRWLLVYRKEGG